MNYHNYVNTVQFNLDRDKLRESCEFIYEDVLEKYSNEKNEYEDFGKGIKTTGLYMHYNIFTYQLPEIANLYGCISSAYRDISKNQDQCFIAGWLNLFNKGDYIDWHGHSDGKDGQNAWHGYYGLDVEPSTTSYRIEGVEGQVDVINKNNQLILSPSHKDKHRTWGWEQERPRITIAFDIVPAENFTTYKIKNWANHWIPLY